MGKTTIYRWIAAHEADGSEALLPSRRPPLTGRKVYITRAWDAAVPFDDETKAAIRDKLDLRIRSLWAASPDYGWRWVADLAARYLAELTAEAGFDPAKANHDSLFRLGQLRVSKDGRKYRAVAIYDHDRKRWEDENRPRIRRTRATRRPMEIVFGDMHPMDLLLPRADGSTFTALLAAFARDASRVMGRDGFKWAGRTYRAPELDAVAAGTPLHLRVPIFSGTDAISVMRGEELLCVAWPDAAYDALDTAGARDAAGRHAAARRAVKAARGDTEPLDLRELLDRMAAKAGPASDPEAEAVVRLDDASRTMGRAMRQTPAARPADENEIERLREERRREALRWFLPKTGTDG